MFSKDQRIDSLIQKDTSIVDHIVAYIHCNTDCTITTIIITLWISNLCYHCPCIRGRSSSASSDPEKSSQLCPPRGSSTPGRSKDMAAEARDVWFDGGTSSFGSRHDTDRDGDEVEANAAGGVARSDTHAVNNGCIE